MTESESRMVDAGKQPDEETVSAWLGAEGHRYWTRVVGFIEANYPGVFEPDWQYGGRKHGWGLRYWKTKSLCTLIPERGQMMIQIVFGAEERAKVEPMVSDLASHAAEDYRSATTYNDGKWLLVKMDGDDVAADVERLLTTKRRPRAGTGN